MPMRFNEILNKLPFAKPFLFVDELFHVDENGASGSFTFHKEMDFFKGHFVNEPIVPGSILTETMAQIGGACLGIYLILNDNEHNDKVYVATSYHVDFYLPVFPDEKIMVSSEKIYARFGKLKYNAVAKNLSGEIVAKGVFSGMLKS